MLGGLPRAGKEKGEKGYANAVMVLGGAVGKCQHHCLAGVRRERTGIPHAGFYSFLSNCLS